jgi:hypothetical protein
MSTQALSVLMLHHRTTRNSHHKQATTVPGRLSANAHLVTAWQTQVIICRLLTISLPRCALLLQALATRWCRPCPTQTADVQSPPVAGNRHAWPNAAHHWATTVDRTLGGILAAAVPNMTLAKSVTVYYHDPQPQSAGHTTHGASSRACHVDTCNAGVL